MQSLEAGCEEAEVISTTIPNCQCDAKSLKANNMVCSHHRAFKPKLSKSSRTAPVPESPIPIDLPIYSSPSTSYCKSLQVQAHHQLSPHSAPLPFSIHAKLLELYEEECQMDPNKRNTGLKRNFHLLEKLMPRERLNTLIVTLYPGNKGYSMSIPKPPSYGGSTNMGQPCNVATDDNTAEDTVEWPYEENVFPSYINKQELPAFLINLLKRHCSFLFYTGCIIAEVRDYRQSYPGSKCDIYHVLLRPTNQSILADVRGMSKGDSWTAEDKLQMESQIYLANYPKLCLDPNSSISKTMHMITSNKQILDTHRLRHSASKHSISSVNQKRRLEQFTSRPDLQLYSFVSNMRTAKSTTAGSSSSLSPPCKIPRKSLLLSSASGMFSGSSASASSLSNGDDPLRTPVAVPNLDAPPTLAPPTAPTLITQFKAHARPPHTSDCSPQLVETYVLETDIPTRMSDKAGPSTSATPGKRVYHIRLSILQRPSNGEYLGELYLDRDHKEGETNGVACKFSLGTSAHANRYIQQFTEIVTESGRKPIRINYGPAPELKEKVMQMLQQMPQQHQQQFAQLQLQQQQQHLQQQQVQQQLQQQLQQQQIQNTQAKALSQSTKELEINAIAAQLMTDTQQFQAAAYAKQQQQNREKIQQAQHSSNNIGNNIAICNILNAPVISTSINAVAAAAAVATPDVNNTATMLVNHQLTPQQKAALNHKLINRKFTLSSLTGVPVTRNLLVNNNHYNHHRLNLGDLQAAAASTAAGQQTITLANFTSIPIVPVQQQQPQPSQQPGTVARVPIMSSGDGGKSALSAMLDGTPSADRPGLIQNTSSSLLLEKFSAVAAAAAAAVNQTVSVTSASPTATTLYVHSPKSILSPLASPPPTATLTAPGILSSATSTPTIPAPTIHFTTQISPEQQQQLQLQAAFSQPISLLGSATTSTGTASVGGSGGSLLVSMPVSSSVGGVAGTSREQQLVSLATTGGSGSLGTTTVVFANVGGSNIAQLVTAGVKGLTAQNLRAAAAAAAAASSVGGPTAVTLTSSTVNSCSTGSGTIQAGGATFQLLTTSSAAAAAAAAAIQQQQQRLAVGQARLQPAIIGGHQVVGITPNVQGVSGGRTTLQRGTPITIKMATAAQGGNAVAAPSQLQLQDATTLHLQFERK